jgi:hypothetical protein
MPIPLVAASARVLVRATNKPETKQAVSESKKKERDEGRESGGITRSAFLILAILCSAVALAQDYQWKDAKVIDITSERGGAVVTPIAALAGVPMTKTFYWIQTNDTIYVLGPAKRQLLNVTLYEPTKVAIDGNNAIILDDYGKDKKLPVVEKVARPKSGDPQ